MFNLLMSKIEMKNLWKLMVAALVIIGATACTETEESVDANEQAGVSFYATFGDDDTRAYIDNSDGDTTWTTVWEEGDVLLVAKTADYIDFTFECTDAATGKFTCEESAAATLIGQTVLISSDSGKHPRDSRLGKKALSVWTTGVEFAQDATIQLTSQTSFLRYTYEGEGAVTLKLELQSDKGTNIKSFRSFDNETEDFTVADEITFSGIKGENFVPFWCGIDPAFDPREATLSYSIDGVKVKETTINHICSGKVYNLGTLTDPEPAYELSAYSVPGTHNNWTAGETPMYIVGDYCVAFNVEFADDGAFKILGDKWIGANNLTVGKWTATGDSDINVSAGTYDIYYSEAESKICVVAAGEEVPAMPVFSVGVVGLGGNWDTDTDMTLEGEYYTLKNVTIAATDTFKLRISDAWDENYGIASSETADTVAINVDAMYTLVQDGKNMQVAAGTYDLYFDYETKEFYVLTPGTTPEELEIRQYKIYVYKFETNWTNTYLYTWDSNDAKHTGEWPGSTTSEIVTINGYEYMVWTLPRTATGKNLNAILTNNSGDQTQDYELGSLTEDKYILLYSGAAMPIEDINNPEPEAPTQTYKVYVYKYNNTWSKLNLYTWDATTNATYTGGWPGASTTITETINGYTYYVWEMPATAVGRQFRMILNNGSNQTGDSDAYTLDRDIYIRLNGSAIQNIDDPNNPEPTVESVERKIYATTTLSWSKMNLYAWGGGSNFTWPGKAMTTETINGTKYYVYTFDKSMDGATLSGVIFNNGSSQTVDITNVKLDQDRFFKVLTTTSGSKYKYEEIADPR